ncbi:RNA-binding domain-containing protein [Choiromyces venosus 120613-1]|uniref:RNA-binding domain-containing protein n=1 Tax=Choiromyces venosus 120613-1 TaxID=1336337 RepID=A0A3N4K0H4_9PEZI|nr:RNA-binding domain-containing protein [Choiromyces venosus 120613-1]
MSGARHWEQDKEATVYIGNLDERVSDALVWELMLQAGRIVNVHLPKDRVTQTHQGFGFVEFISEEDAEYAARIMNQVRLYGKPIRVNKASADKQKTVEVGAELFVGNLDPMVDEKTLFDTFSTFGNLVSAPKIARDDQGISKGFGFISYDSFEASDKAIESMHNQFLMNKEINVQYAYKKDGKGERHGDQAERLLAAQAKKHNVQITPQQLPAQLFAPTGPSGGVPPIPVGAGPPAPSGPGNFQRGPPTRPQNGMPNPHDQGFQGGAGGGFQGGFHAPPPGPPQGFPPAGRGGAPQHHAPPHQPQLAPPPQGLPARPPPPVGFQPHQQHAYGRPPPPVGFAQPMHPGFGQPPPLPAGFGGPQQQAPQGFPGQAPGAPPGATGFAPPGPPPPGYGGYGRGR